MGELLTLKEVGRILKIEGETVRRKWILTGILPASKDTGKWLVDQDDLPRAMAEKSRRTQETKTRKQDDAARTHGPDPFSDLNATISPAGECTRDAEKDQHYRDTRGKEWTPPDIPE